MTNQYINRKFSLCEIHILKRDTVLWVQFFPLAPGRAVWLVEF